MKCQYLLWVQQTLTPAQKVMPIKLAFAKYDHMNYHFLLTGDESWMFYAYDHRMKLVAS
jgi:hypothetical protein